MIDIDSNDENLPTQKDLTALCKNIASNMKKYTALYDKKEEIPDNLINSLDTDLDKLSDMTEMEGFFDTLFSSEVYPFFNSLISFPNREVSSSFVSIIADYADDPKNIERILKEDFITNAINACEKLDEVNIQSDAQFLYITFELISIVLDGCDDSKQVAENIIKNTNILKIITKQFERDDFDENVLGASELLAIMLQMSPELAESIDIGLINLIVRFCANMRSTKQADQDEAASNAFNIIILLAINEKSLAKLIEVNAISVLLECMDLSSNSKTEKSSARLALNAIESCCSASATCCEQLVDNGGLKKVFGLIKESKIVSNKSLCSNIISIIESMLTLLPIQSLQMERVIRKFIENNYSKVHIFIEIGEKLFENVKFDDDGNIDANDDSFDTFCLICSSLTVLVGIGPKELKIETLKAILLSDVIDAELIIDSASERADLAPSIKERLTNCIQVLSKLTEN